MRFFSCSVLFLILLKYFGVFSWHFNFNLPEEDVEKTYQNWINQTYDDIEGALRQKMFEKNLNIIKSNNKKYEAGKVTYQLGLNHLAHLTEFEFQKMLGYKQDTVALTRGIQDTFVGITLSALGVLLYFYLQLVCPKIPNDNKLVDFRPNKCSLGVLDQGQCGSCYAFSTIQVLSYNDCVNCKRTTPLQPSPQQIVDCSQDQGNQGCNGGLMEYSTNYIKQAPGIEEEAEYQYQATEGQCRFNKDKANFKQVTNYTKVQWCETEMMKYLDLNVALCVAINVPSDGSFQSYKTGVYGDEISCSKTLPLNHAVLIVGYGVCNETSRPYWLIKNSWSAKWGEAGYIRLLRGCCCIGVCLSVGYPESSCDP